ncbi:MAG: DUF1178 family protein [Pseudomonadota bacterium]
MILFDLRCSNGHDFEAWFRDSAAYDQQSEEGAITCAVCGDSNVTKALMAPAVSSGPKIDDQQAAKMLKKWREVQSQIEKNFDHVGRQFPEEARKMHYGETEKRGIYGEATRAEAKELSDEGVQVSPIPWLPPQDS